MKRVAIIFFAVLLSKSALTQDDYQKFIQSSLKGDTALAEQILRNSTKTEFVQENIFPIKNSTEHIFKMNIDALKDSIINFFENDLGINKFLSNIFYRYDYQDDDTSKRTINFFSETMKDKVFSKDYFSEAGTANDVFLTVYHQAWESKFYYAKDHALNYTTDFALKLLKVENSSTKITVVALNPEVINGTSLGAHGTTYEYAKVHPTTIEEYSLLLFIADKLGDKTLPPLKLPTK